MSPDSALTTARVLDVFTEEIAARGGRVTDTFHEGERLFTRSVLAPVEEVRPGDGLQGGVALKATEEGLWLYPYVFRLVCRNGAIMAETLEARSLENLHDQDPETALQCIREGVGACCAPEVFHNTVRRMRSTCELRADAALNMLPLLSRLSTLGSARLVSQIMQQFFGEGDQSLFGLANAFTAIARDTQDPELRWNLEELGGGIAIGIVPPHPIDAGYAAMPGSRREVEVG